MTQRILITGATSGLGAAVALRLASRGTHLVLPARLSARASKLAETLAAAGAASVHMPPLELASPAGVRTCVEHILATDRSLDAVLLNAGIQCVGAPTATAAGIETTFATNHLGHHALVRGIDAALSPTAIIGWTSSGTHHPSNRLAQVFGFRGARYDLDASGFVAGAVASGAQRCRDAYATSKGLNVVSARWFASQQPRRTWFAFDPGLMPGTGLARDQPALIRAIWSYVMPWLLRPMPGVSTPERSSKTLAELLSGHMPLSQNGALIDDVGRTLRPYLPSDEHDYADRLIARSDALIAAW